MTDVRDPAALLEAARHAAAAGDYAAAEPLLREAAAIQEISLGPLHPELASTLNNLALVCERVEKLDEAERGYRRAHAIAVASLAPGHPFIAISLQNLVDFCAAHEIPIWKSSAGGPDGTSSGGPSEAVAQAEPVPAAVRFRLGEALAAMRGPRKLTLAAVGVAIAIVAVIAFAMRERGIEDPGVAPLQEQGRLPADQPPPTPAPAADGSAPVVAIEKPAASALPVENPNRAARTTTSAPISVLTAQLCSALERTGSPDWQCAPMNRQSPPGTYMFYTRLLTQVDTTVEHRWYRGERAHQVTRLRVAPSPGRGFRTFSSSTISPERAGDWRVELTAADGTVLREERFVIR